MYFTHMRMNMDSLELEPNSKLILFVWGIFDVRKNELVKSTNNN